MRARVSGEGGVVRVGGEVEGGVEWRGVRVSGVRGEGERVSGEKVKAPNESGHSDIGIGLKKCTSLCQYAQNAMQKKHTQKTRRITTAKKTEKTNRLTLEDRPSDSVRMAATSSWCFFLTRTIWLWYF